MSIDYVNVQEHKERYVAAEIEAAAVLQQFWSKTHQWRCIGMDLLVVTAATVGASFKLRNDTQSNDLVTVDCADDAADTMYEGRVAADSDALVAVADIVQLISIEDDDTAVIEITVITTRTSA